MPVDFKRPACDMLLVNKPGLIFQTLPALSNQLMEVQCKDDDRLEIMQRADNIFQII
jgi:hypothetical protein